MPRSAFIAAALVAVGAALSVVHAGEARDLVRILGAGRTDARAIERLDVIINRVEPEGLVAEATDAQQAALRARGFGIETITPRIDLVYLRNSLGLDGFAGYLTYQQFVDSMHSVAQRHSFVRLETLGYSYDDSLLLALKFSDNPDVHENEPAVHFEADIHGDEAIGYAVLVEMVRYLAENYGVDSTVTRLIDGREIWLVPLVNPDGYIDQSRYNGNRVDLNRNWGWMWGGETRPGSAPLSEPESEALQRHIWRHPFVTFVSYHAGTEFISHPWSYAEARQNTIPELSLIRFLSAKYDYYTAYTYGQGADSMYWINGSTKDFDYGFGGMMSWSIEIHYTKWPAASAIEPTFNDNRPAILDFCHFAGQGIHGTVTDAQTDAPVHAMVLVGEADWPSYTHPELGDFHRFYLPGTYDVTVRAPGYRDTTLAGVVVPATGDSAVTVDVALTPDPTAGLWAFRGVWSRYVNPSTNRTYPVAALGPHDGAAYRLDSGKDICLDLDVPVRNGTGVDLTVHRAGSSGAAQVQGASDWTGPWTTIGNADQAETQFDLGAAGLDSVRYVRLAASSAFDLDAVEGMIFTSVAEPAVSAPRPVRLSVRGNPSHGTVRFLLDRRPDPGTTLDVRDAAGRRVAGLTADRRTLAWNAAALPAGIYFASLDSGSSNIVRLVITR